MIVGSISNINLRVSLTLYVIYIFLPITRTFPTIFKAMFEAFALLFLLLHDYPNSKRTLKDFIFILNTIIISLILCFGIWIPSGVDFVNKFLMLIVFWTALYYYESIKDASFSTIRYIVELFEILILITTITTIIGNISNPYASRQLASTLDISLNRYYQSLNIGGYGFVYGLVLYIPYLFHCFKNEKKIKYIVFLLFTELAIIVSAYMTAIILSILVLLMCLIISSKQRQLIIGFIILCLFTFVIFNPIYANLLHALYEKLEFSGHHILAERVNNIKVFISEWNLAGDLKYRNELAQYSIDALVSSPLYGNLFGDKHILGLHSEFIDILAGTGLIGFLVIVLLLSKRLTSIIRYIKDSIFKSFAYIGIFTFISIGFINTITSSPELSAIIFILYSSMSWNMLISPDWIEFQGDSDWTQLQRWITHDDETVRRSVQCENDSESKKGNRR